MADEMTAASRAAGFGATEQKTDNSDQISELLDQVRDLMVEDGADAATAEALTNFARPTSITYAGNLADLNRMGKIAVRGEIDTAAGEKNIPATDLSEAFAQPPEPDLNQGLQTPLGQITGEGEPTGTTVGDTTDASSDTRTKADLQAELDAQGIEYSSSDTKSELLAKLEG